MPLDTTQINLQQASAALKAANDQMTLVMQNAESTFDDQQAAALALQTANIAMGAAQAAWAAAQS